MERRSERFVALLAVLFVFSCLLLSGGSRLIGFSGEEIPVPVRQVMHVHAALSRMPEPSAELASVPARQQSTVRVVAVPAEENLILNHRVQCDANGNVIGAKDYLHAVYQAFALGDGFV